MERGRARLEAPDLSEKGGLKDGEPQRSDERLFMQFLAFGGSRGAAAIGAHLQEARINGVVYEDLNDPTGVGILTLSTRPDAFSIACVPRSSAARARHSSRSPS